MRRDEKDEKAKMCRFVRVIGDEKDESPYRDSSFVPDPSSRTDGVHLVRAAANGCAPHPRAPVARGQGVAFRRVYTPAPTKREGTGKPRGGRGSWKPQIPPNFGC